MTRRHSEGTGGIPARIALTLALVVALLGGSTAAWSIWMPHSAPGWGAASATSVGSGAVPSVTHSSGSITLSWTPAALVSGAPVTGYLVRRYSAADLSEQTITTNCAGVITDLECVETGVPAGTWTYTVTPLVGTQWVGAESAQSEPVASAGEGATNRVWMWITP